MTFRAQGGSERSGARPEEDRGAPTWVTGLLLLVWLCAAAAVFLPFALDTSPWDAVTFRVPDNQGNWWHALIGAPFLLAFPMIWLRLRGLFSAHLSTATGRRWIWMVAGASICGTILVETPFMVHLAGTSEWQRLAVLGLGLGIIVASGAVVRLRRRALSPTRACLLALNTAYIANLSLCLLVYSEATGSVRSRSGWFVMMVMVWPIMLELLWIMIQAFKTRPLFRKATV